MENFLIFDAKESNSLVFLCFGIVKTLLQQGFFSIIGSDVIMIIITQKG